MERPFDPTLKTLAELAPADWLPLIGRRRRRVTIEDSDVATTVSAATDKVLRVPDDPEYLLHLDFESGHFRSRLLLRLRMYNGLLEYRHNRVVLSVPVLLSPAADSPRWDGLLRRGLPGDVPVRTLRYHVIRVWQLPVETLLNGGIGTLALAPVSDVREDELQRVQERLSGPRAPQRARDIWAAAYVLLGLRYSDELADVLFEEVLGMEESATYQAIVRRGREQGRVEEARRVLLIGGETKFGPPDAATRAALEAINDLGQLEALVVRLLSVDSWQALMPPRDPRRRGGHRRTGP